MAKEILLDGGVTQEGAPKRWWEVYKLHWKCNQMLSKLWRNIHFTHSRPVPIPNLPHTPPRMMIIDVDIDDNESNLIGIPIAKLHISRLRKQKEIIYHRHDENLRFPS